MTVALVGAGPGDPGLLTVRGAELLRAADVVIYDALAEPSLLDLAPPQAVRIDVGKRPGAPVDQEEINGLLIEHGRAGRAVVRLKGGDPFVFGRGGEEAEALIAAGVPFEVVPGVSSAIAVPAYAGIPVTHRGVSTSFTVVTGHSRHAVDTETDWPSIAHTAGTIVVLMGVAHRAAIAERLIAAGLDPATPAAAIQWGTRPEQRSTRTTLAGLGDAALQPPATIVIGRVAGLDLGWWERRPLRGKRIVVTRARDQASVLTSRLTALGADVIEAPTIETADPSDGGAALASAAASVATYDWVVFTSATAVHRLMALVPDARSFGAARIAVVGSATADALAGYHLVADLVPPRFVAEALAGAFPPGAGRVLFPKAGGARDVVPVGLRAKGWVVDEVDAYCTRAVVPSDDVLEAVARADAATFTSSSTVTNLLAVTRRLPPVIICMGPITARTARDAGLSVDDVADPSTLEGLVAAVLRRLE